MVMFVTMFQVAKEGTPERGPGNKAWG
jgi:hypothetical protein